MNRIRGLELLFNLVESRLQSKEDCLVAALHCLLINENLICVGTGEEFLDEDAHSTTELLPDGWNDNQELYVLRYVTKDFKKRLLMKIVKTGRSMHVNIVLNEDFIASVSFNIDKYVTNEHTEYSTAYQELDALSESFRNNILQNIHGDSSKQSIPQARGRVSSSSGSLQSPGAHRPAPGFENRTRQEPPPFPRLGGVPCPNIGGSDLDPLGRGQGSMLVDPSNFGIPFQPNMPPFGGRFGLPRGSVPPGARFDPFGPPVRGPNIFHPDPDHYKPPDSDDII